MCGIRLVLYFLLAAKSYRTLLLTRTHTTHTHTLRGRAVGEREWREVCIFCSVSVQGRDWWWVVGVVVGSVWRGRLQLLSQGARLRNEPIGL